MKTILVALDGSPFSEHALPAALALAQRSGAALAIAHVHQMSTPAVALSGELLFDSTLDNLLCEEEQAYLDSMAARLAVALGRPVRATLLDGPVIKALVRHAQAIDASTILLTTHGRGGIARAWLGSVADQLMRQSPVPVMVLHPQDTEPDLVATPVFRHILIPLDGSPLAEQAIPLALKLGRPMGARYTLLQVVAPMMRGYFVDGLSTHPDTKALEQNWAMAQSYLEKVAAPLREAGHVVNALAPVGQPAEAILRIASEQSADLIALTTRGHGGLARMLLGSVADKLVRGAKIPLLVYHPIADREHVEEEALEQAQA